MSILSRPFLKEISILAIPVTTQSVLVALLGLADVMMVGHLGESAVAAVGLAAKLHFVTIVFIFGLSNACNALISQYIGASQMEKVKRVLGLTLATGCALLFPVSILFAWSPSWWLSAISNDAEVVALSASYLQITSSVVLVMTIILVYETGLRALGQTVMPLVLTSVAIALNVLLNYVLINGIGIFPEMGVDGAALATTLSRVFELMLLFAVLYWRKHVLWLSWVVFKGLNSLTQWRNFWVFALPVAINFVVWGLGSSVYHMIASKMGTVPLAVMSVIAPIESILISTFMGFSTACSILLGRELGKDNFDYAWQLKTFFIRAGVILSAVAGGVMWLIKDYILAPFGDLNEEIMSIIHLCFLVMCLVIPLRVHNMMSMASILRAGGDTLWCFKIDVVCMWLLGIPIMAFLGLALETAFLIAFIGMYTEDLVKLFASQWRMNQRQWLRNLTHIV